MIKNYLFPAMLLAVGNASEGYLQVSLDGKLETCCLNNDLQPVCFPGYQPTILANQQCPDTELAKLYRDPQYNAAQRHIRSDSDLGPIALKSGGYLQFSQDGLTKTCCCDAQELICFTGYQPLINGSPSCLDTGPLSVDGYLANNSSVCESLDFYKTSLSQLTATQKLNRQNEAYIKFITPEKGRSFPSWFEPLKKNEEREFFSKVSCALGLKSRPDSWSKLREQFSKVPRHAAVQARICDLIARYIHIMQGLLEIKRNKPKITPSFAMGNLKFYRGTDPDNTMKDWRAQKEANTPFAVSVSEQIDRMNEIGAEFRSAVAADCLEGIDDDDKTFLQRVSNVMGFKGITTSRNIPSHFERYYVVWEIQERLVWAIKDELRWTRKERGRA